MLGVLVTCCISQTISHKGLSCMRRLVSGIDITAHTACVAGFMFGACWDGAAQGGDMLHKILVGLLSILLVAVFWGAALAESKADAEALVKSAEQYYKTNGEDKTLEEISKPDGSFVKEGKRLYVFAYDKEGTLVAIPINQQLIGKNMLKIPDTAGKMYRQEIIEKVTVNGEA